MQICDLDPNNEQLIRQAAVLLVEGSRGGGRKLARCPCAAAPTCLVLPWYGHGGMIGIRPDA
jgi:hypothetical protein